MKKKRRYQGKFQKGDFVVLSRNCGRLPKWIRNQVYLSQKRQIISVYYNRKTKHNAYHLGYNGRGLDLRPYPFRSTEIKLYRMKLHTRRLRLKTREH